MSTKDYRDLTRRLRSGVQAAANEFKAGQLSGRELGHSVQAAVWQSLVAGTPFSSQKRKTYIELMGKQAKIASALAAGQSDCLAYLAQMRAIDDALRHLDLGDQLYARYQARIEEARVASQTTASPATKHFAYIPREPGCKEGVLRFLNTIRLFKGTCPGGKGSPSTPSPVWVSMRFPQLQMSWGPSVAAPECSVSYTVQVHRFNREPRLQLAKGITENAYTMRERAGTSGRWRVWAVDGSGRRSRKSTWQYYIALPFVHGHGYDTQSGSWI